MTGADGEAHSLALQGTGTSPGPASQRAGIGLPVLGGGGPPGPMQLVTADSRAGQGSKHRGGLASMLCLWIAGASAFRSFLGPISPGCNPCMHTSLSKRTVAAPPKAQGSGHFCKSPARSGWGRLPGECSHGPELALETLAWTPGYMGASGGGTGCWGQGTFRVWLI